MMQRARIGPVALATYLREQYPTLLPCGIVGGSGYWRGFAERADDAELMRAIGAAEYYKDGLVALRGDPRELQFAAKLYF